VSTPKDAAFHAEVLALHGVAVGDIAFFKSQQWHVTNYALLLYGAVVALSRLLGSPSPLEFLVLGLLAAATFVVGCVVILQLEASIKKGRDRLSALRVHMSDVAMEAWAAGEERVESYREGKDKSTLRWLFHSVLAIGFGVDMWLLGRAAFSA
jgi:hypothetical protein